jgi:hypothetical protein
MISSLALIAHNELSLYQYANAAWAMTFGISGAFLIEKSFKRKDGSLNALSTNISEAQDMLDRRAADFYKRFGETSHQSIRMTSGDFQEMLRSPAMCALSLAVALILQSHPIYSDSMVGSPHNSIIVRLLLFGAANVLFLSFFFLSFSLISMKFLKRRISQ